MPGPVSHVPFIPDNAPFTAEQRAWLNGFLAGIYSYTEATPAAALPALKIAVLYASQSGTAEGLARKLTKELTSKGHVATFLPLEGYTPAALAAERYALLIASTYGEGDPPDAVQPFYNQLCMEHFPRFENLSFSVLALGDSNYEHFCKFGRDLDEKLASLGAFRMCERVDCDVDPVEPFGRWKSLLFKSIEEMVAARPAKRAAATDATRPADSSASSEPEQPKKKTAAHTRDNPFLAPIVEKRPLTHEVSSKLTLHMAFSVEGSAVTYEAGDACAVIPQNEPILVEEILHKLKFNGDVLVQLPKAGTVPLQSALLDHLQITRLTRKMVQAYATIGECLPLLDLLKPEQQSHLDAYTWDRGLIDLLYEFPEVLRDPADLVAMLPKLSPRLYSISSSPAADAGEIHTTVAVVRYRSHNRERGGVCSTMFADRSQTECRLPI